MMFFEKATTAPEPSVSAARAKNESVVRSGTARQRRPHPTEVQDASSGSTSRRRGCRRRRRCAVGGGRSGRTRRSCVGLIGALPIHVHRVAEVGRGFVAAWLALRRVVVFTSGHRRRVLVASGVAARAAVSLRGER